MERSQIQGASPIATLRQVARSRAPRRARERCDLCSVDLRPVHRHLLERATRRIQCACDACALTFENVINGRFQVIPRDLRALAGMRIGSGVWQSLGLPIELAFIYEDSRDAKRRARYPSPAGAAESILAAGCWESLAADNPALAEVKPDVEALLVNRTGAAQQYFIAPIDRCYELSAFIRMHWRGFSGGDELWRKLERHFEQLNAEARVVAACSEEGAARA